MADINRQRTQTHLQTLDVEALVLSKPESFIWATGAPPGVAAFFRRAGAALALVPADAAAPIAAVVTELFATQARRILGDSHVRTHPDWVETADIRSVLKANPDATAVMSVNQAHLTSGRAAGFERPAVFDIGLALRQLGELLRERGLANARIGLDFDFWPVVDFQILQTTLPNVRWVDASTTVAAIKAVKSTAEITRLIQAASLAEAGMRHALSQVTEGITRDAIAAAWHAGVATEAQRTGTKLTGQWEYTTVGALPWQGGGVLQQGDVLKFDVGCLVEGYSSDSGRTYVLGQPRARTYDIMQTLANAFAAGLEVLRPGYLLSDVYTRTTQAIRKAGFSSFTRGHFGHSLGQDTFCEVAPFIAAQSHTPIEPGMVLAFETPLYVDGEGGFIIEDQFVITETGATPAWTLPRELTSLS
ncbi:Xaa-Pro peptidase family protein [Rhodoferax sp.]|uniref:M24 family metallopeptidase n=1 Tax=Rhodoferax sp. TaxID=50421 RepID=UPI00262980AA|nr:Xaa-Pro peptidase family protein [Rhodoferax sp.]MDD2926598.1 Xaa-Pro peptidase family protein [Rhodoferax sp.]